MAILINDGTAIITGHTGSDVGLTILKASLPKWYKVIEHKQWCTYNVMFMGRVRVLQLLSDDGQAFIYWKYPSPEVASNVNWVHLNVNDPNFAKRLRWAIRSRMGSILWASLKSLASYWPWWMGIPIGMAILWVLVISLLSTAQALFVR